MPRPSVKDKLLDTAQKLLHERGFNATGVQEIVDAAGVPKGSFYNHFESKEALAIEALDRYWKNVLNTLKILDDSTMRPVDRLKTYFNSLNEVAVKLKYRPGCMIGNFGSELSDQSDAVRARLRHAMAEWTSAISRCISAAQDDGSFRKDIDSKAAAAFLLNSWEGAVLRSKIDRSRNSLTTFENMAFASLMK